MILFGLKTCDTCRKARKALAGCDFVDVREAGLPQGVMERALDTFGEALVNRRSTTWRGLSDEARAKAPAALLAAHPSLMKRPLIFEDDGTLHLGWGPDVRAKLLG